MTTTGGPDAQRVAEIGKYRVLVEPPRADLLAIVEIAAQVAQVPMATINLITDVEQHQIATHGFDASVCAREDSMCNVVLDAGRPVVVPDASLDPRFRDNPFVTGVIGSVRFYATHQLRTPEDVVIGTLCVFDEVRRTLSDEQEHALVGLADRVVDLLELELRTRELERSNEQLAAFAGQVSHDLRNPLTAVTMSLSMMGDEIAEDDADLMFLVQLRAVLQNLVANAAKFVRPGQPAHIEVDAARIGDRWRIEVCDRGPGIPADQQERVFQPLARVNEDVEGSGIGLTTCRRIVEAHGGRIGLTDSAYGGTCAWFELPE